MARRKRPRHDSPQQKLVREWCKNQPKMSARRLGIEVGAENGHVGNWIIGSRKSLPLKFKVAIARRTGLRLEDIVRPEEMETARELFAVFARDCAGNGAAA